MSTSGERNVVIGGEAGQGLVTVGYLLAKSLVRSGFHIVVTQGYMSRIRGGHNTFAVRISGSPIASPGGKTDILVALDQQTVDVDRADLAPDGIIVADSGMDAHGLSSLAVPYAQLGSAKTANVTALGVLGSLLGLDELLLANTIADFFGAGKGKADQTDANKQALASAYAWAKADATTLARMALPQPDRSKSRMMLNGNEALALGALKAGVGFSAFYPMTPSTSIALTLIEHADKADMIVEQAEDEISAINMAIGASFAGARSIVTTSGGGFALMVEGVSLAGMTETPVVIVVGQRPGPATGLPTRTEQAELEFVLHTGHGEFPRVIFAPGSVEQCFHLTQKAFMLADRHQIPSFILTDQFLADSYRAVEQFDLSDAYATQPSAIPSGAPYNRFKITENGVSPRLLPGATTSLVIVDSDEHTEDGHITEDLTVRRQMVEKRLRKGHGVLADVVPPEYTGPEMPDILLVSWGSTRGAASEAASILNAQGRSAATLHFSQVWPLRPDHFVDHFKNAGKVVVVEGNATAQFARIVRGETGLDVDLHVLRYDGLPITPEYILERLK
jgi:2-oxoglutarate/2-oxoacid ferredoxin oxidoreductase subunit alpha